MATTSAPRRHENRNGQRKEQECPASIHGPVGLTITSLKLQTLVLSLQKDRLLRNNAIYLAGSIGAGALGYVFHFLTGRMLGPAGYAVLASVLSALYLVSLPGIVLQTVSMRFTSLAAGRSRLGSLHILLVRLGIVSLAAGVLGAGILVWIAPTVAHYLQVADQRLVYVLAGAGVLGWVLAVNRGALQGLSKFVALSANGLVDMSSRVASATILILSGAGVVGGLLAIMIGPFFAYLHSLAALRRIRGTPVEPEASMRDVGRYALSASVGVIGITYLFNADVLLAKHYLAPQVAGIYASGAVLGRVVFFLGVTVAAVMFPTVAALHARAQAHFQVVDRSLLLLGAVAIGCSLVYLVLPELVLWPYGAAFTPVRPYLGGFAFALGLLSLSNLLINYFLSVNSTRFAVPLIGACILETGLIVLLHGSIGQVLAMVWTSMAALTLVLGALYALERRRAEKTLRRVA
jgi:O-antigen/teichoic acid export membrane protein